MCCTYQISRKALKGFVPNSHPRLVWCLARTSLDVEVKGQRSSSPGTKTRCALPSPRQRRNGLVCCIQRVTVYCQRGACVRFMFVLRSFLNPSRRTWSEAFLMSTKPWLNAQLLMTMLHSCQSNGKCVPSTWHAVCDTPIVHQCTRPVCSSFTLNRSSSSLKKFSTLDSNNHEHDWHTRTQRIPFCLSRCGLLVQQLSRATNR